LCICICERKIKNEPVFNLKCIMNYKQALFKLSRLIKNLDSTKKVSITIPYDGKNKFFILRFPHGEIKIVLKNCSVMPVYLGLGYVLLPTNNFVFKSKDVCRLIKEAIKLARSKQSKQ